jgi:hypothetical protein
MLYPVITKSWTNYVYLRTLIMFVGVWELCQFQKEEEALKMSTFNLPLPKKTIHMVHLRFPQWWILRTWSFCSLLYSLLDGKLCFKGTRSELRTNSTWHRSVDWWYGWIYVGQDPCFMKRRQRKKLLQDIHDRCTSEVAVFHIYIVLCWVVCTELLKLLWIMLFLFQCGND